MTIDYDHNAVADFDTYKNLHVEGDRGKRRTAIPSCTRASRTRSKAELSKGGLTEVDSNPDLWIHLPRQVQGGDAHRHRLTSATATGAAGAATADMAAMPGWVRRRLNVRTYTKGTLIIDIIDAKKNSAHLAWHGHGQRFRQSREEREEDLQGDREALQEVGEDEEERPVRLAQKVKRALSPKSQMSSTSSFSAGWWSSCTLGVMARFFASWNL